MFVNSKLSLAKFIILWKVLGQLYFSQSLQRHISVQTKPLFYICNAKKSIPSYICTCLTQPLTLEQGLKMSSLVCNFVFRHPKSSHDQLGILMLVLQYEKTSTEKQYNWLAISPAKTMLMFILILSNI